MSYASQTGIANNHNFTDTTTVEYSANQTDTTVVAAQTTEGADRIQIVSVKLETKATTGQAKLYDSKSNQTIAILNAENNGSGDYTMRFVGAKSSPVKLTSTTGTNSLFVSINWKPTGDPTENTSSTTTSTSTSTSTSTTISTSTTTSTS